MKLKGLSRLMYAVSKSYRKSKDESWQEREGTPPPWTAAGQQFRAALSTQNELVAKPPPIHGDARFMTGPEIIDLNTEAVRANENSSRGDRILFLGRGYDPKDGQEYGQAVSAPLGHLLTIAATRSGKGQSQIVPNLLRYGGSMLVIDPKGENYAMSHVKRRDFGRVIRIDPFGITNAIDPVNAYSGFNPMEFVEGESEAKRLATVILGDGPGGEAQFWHEEALNLLSAAILATTSLGQTQLADVRKLLATSNRPKKDAPSELFTNLEILAKSTPQIGAQRRIESFMGYEAKMASSILATINAKMSMWDTPEIAKAVSFTDIPFEDLKKAPATIYVILPMDKLQDYKAFVRLMIGGFYQAMIKDPNEPEIPVTCVIDEFPTLGSMGEVVRALAEIAGYGVRFWLFVQSLTQLKEHYPNNWNTIVSQCSTLNVFGVTDGETIKWLTEELGQSTEAIATPSVSIGGAGRSHEGVLNLNDGVSRNVQLEGKPLLTPGEIREFFGVGKDWQLVFLSGHRPMLTQLNPAYADPSFTKILGSAKPLPLAFNPIDESSDYWRGIPKGHKFGVRASNDEI